MKPHHLISAVFLVLATSLHAQDVSLILHNGSVIDSSGEAPTTLIEGMTIADS